MRLSTRLFLGVFLLAALVGFLNLPARACFCEQPPVEQALGRSDAVFVGKVVGAEMQKSKVDKTGNQITYDVGEVYLEVEEAFRGVKVGDRITIHSGWSGGDCGFWFLRGKRYLVYADESSSGRLETSICSRTSMLDRPEDPDWPETAEKDLTYLRRVFREKPNAGILGRCDTHFDSQVRNLNFAGVRILLKNEQTGEIRETRVDAEGIFRFSNVPAGKYILIADISAQKYEQQLFYGRDGKVVVFDRGCASVLLLVKVRSPIVK